MDNLENVDPGFLLLKRATRVLLKAYGTLEAAGEAGKRSGEQMRRYGDPACAETMPIHIVMTLEADIGQPYITRVLAQLAEHTLRPLKGREGGAALPIAKTVAAVAVAEYQHEIALAEADGVITPNEENRIGRAGAKAQAAIGDVLGAIASSRQVGAAPEAQPSASVTTLPRQSGSN